MNPTLLWLRRDLRLDDHPALMAALERGQPVIPVYIRDTDPESNQRSLGGASAWWLHGSLSALHNQLTAKGSRLILKSGTPLEVLQSLQAETGAEALYWSMTFDPADHHLDQSVKAWADDRGIECKRFNANLLYKPCTLQNKSGGFYKVFSPFWKACLASGEPAKPLPEPDQIKAPEIWPTSEPLDHWELTPSKPDWAQGLRTEWQPGAAGAKARLDDFFNAAMGGYAKGRDIPGTPGTSKLSPHLRFGEISPRAVWHAAKAVAGARGWEHSTEHFLRELGWREFSYELLNQNPDIAVTPIQPKFAAFPWRDDDHLMAAWRRGQTGVPIVDAGMRQLWATGWMHNRVRMIVGSYLVKNLLQPWQHGETWFWDTLVDADPASNTASWQWVAGCGADAAPYFRIFNPITQGERFDGNGDYVRHWVPEIAGLPNKYIQKPWEAGPLLLQEAGIKLGETYPEPVVDLKGSRERALAAFRSLSAA